VVEWAECRTTIGRMDTALEDLRKYGFTLVTGLLTASGLVGSATSSTTASQLVPAASLVVMVLVLGLFAVDMYYQVLQRGAVTRAIELERQTIPPLALTQTVSKAARTAGTLYTFPFVYTTFLVAAAAMAWFVKGAQNLAVVVIAAGILVIMVGYYFLIPIRRAKLHQDASAAGSISPFTVAGAANIRDDHAVAGSSPGAASP
jgi:membrane protein YdbS with pleckstrin-like domain